MNLDQLRIELSYNPETGLFHRRGRGKDKAAGKITTKGYRQIFTQGKAHMAHRLAWLYVYGTWPTGQLDHINRIKDDNRIANLREVDNQTNQENVALWNHNRTGFRGVSISKNGKYRADIKVDGKTRHLGTFDKLEDAAAARMAAEKVHFKLLENSPIYSQITHGEVVRVGNSAYSSQAPGTIVVHELTHD